ncbi:hypothetical protein RF11_16017 [Thelohanellus kitauei]|uniref:Uncharacterized protein n=1 Tax=Thelohanellus kitauei TaxID=669202 RepID=A0A0C2JBJ2_THEKT|nr:hypothetical protein RF11_06003 [Thelohanellus kitauei]KII66558.1 hypothetical protein RF11_16017 [Thelohanellus kitauei]
MDIISHVLLSTRRTEKNGLYAIDDWAIHQPPSSRRLIEEMKIEGSDKFIEWQNCVGLLRIIYGSNFIIKHAVCENCLAPHQTRTSLLLIGDYKRDCNFRLCTTEN